MIHFVIVESSCSQVSRCWRNCCPPTQFERMVSLNISISSWLVLLKLVYTLFLLRKSINLLSFWSRLWWDYALEQHEWKLHFICMTTKGRRQDERFWTKIQDKDRLPLPEQEWKWDVLSRKVREQQEIKRQGFFNSKWRCITWPSICDTHLLQNRWSPWSRESRM